MRDMKSEILLGKANVMKHWGNKSCRKSLTVWATLFLELERGAGGTIRPDISICMRDENNETVYATRDLSEIKSIPELSGHPYVGYLELLSKTYRDGIKAGNPEQEESLRNGYALGKVTDLDFRTGRDGQVEWLKSRNLYEMKQDDGTWYRYGHGWANGKPVPDSHLAILKTLMGWA